ERPAGAHCKKSGAIQRRQVGRFSGAYQSIEVTTIIHGHHHDPFSYGSKKQMNIGLRDLFELTRWQL
ncbi:hypothetical protein, partial [Pseudaeromonas pectinilytica]